LQNTIKSALLIRSDSTVPVFRKGAIEAFTSHIIKTLLLVWPSIIQTMQFKAYTSASLALLLALWPTSSIAMAIKSGRDAGAIHSDLGERAHVYEDHRVV
jgi:hypothetical protein